MWTLSLSSRAVHPCHVSSPVNQSHRGCLLGIQSCLRSPDLSPLIWLCSVQLAFIANANLWFGEEVACWHFLAHGRPGKKDLACFYRLIKCRFFFPMCLWDRLLYFQGRERRCQTGNSAYDSGQCVFRWAVGGSGPPPPERRPPSPAGLRLFLEGAFHLPHPP